MTGGESAEREVDRGTFHVSIPRPAAAPIIVLGAGINGAAIARELALNGQAVWVVESHDVAFGATAYSSRLIHGGLRYLEYGEFDLVRESLAERARLLRLAPHRVHPLELMIPVRRRSGGLGQAFARAIGWRWWPVQQATRERGLWAVRAGLTLYDAWSDRASLPKHRIDTAAEVPFPFHADFGWVCRYWDAQILYPERFTLELLSAAEKCAVASGAEFRLFLRARAVLDGRRLHIQKQDPVEADKFEEVCTVEPRAIVNATGAWVDATLQVLRQPSERLVGGTKGSHLVTFHRGLRDALDGRGIYAEAGDGRPVFVLPFDDSVLIGTTDLPFEGDPASAIATEPEIDYLLQAVNRMLPQVALGRRDICLHYCGVRPLPYVGPQTPSGITRRHLLHLCQPAPLPILSVVGGKLTTCRSLAEQVVARILPLVGARATQDSRELPLSGGNGAPGSPESLDNLCAQWAAETGWPVATIRRAWKLWGMQATEVFQSCRELERARPSIAARQVPTDLQQALTETAPLGATSRLTDALVRSTIRREWVEGLDDLIERRLMLLYDEHLSLSTLRRLALLLAEEHQRDRAFAERELNAVLNRLTNHFGRAVSDTDTVPSPENIS